MTVKAFAIAVGTLIGLILVLCIPQMRKEIAFHSVEWPSRGASFEVTDIASGRMQGHPSLQIYCRWANNKGVEKHALQFQDEAVTASNNTRLRIGVSPLGSRDFVIHLPLKHTLLPLAKITIPIQCNQVEDERDLGTQSLIVRYWPVNKTSMKTSEIQ